MVGGELPPPSSGALNARLSNARTMQGRGESSEPPALKRDKTCREAGAQSSIQLGLSGGASQTADRAHIIGGLTWWVGPPPSTRSAHTEQRGDVKKAREAGQQRHFRPACVAARLAPTLPQHGRRIPRHTLRQQWLSLQKRRVRRCSLVGGPARIQWQ